MKKRRLSALLLSVFVAAASFNGCAKQEIPVVELEQIQKIAGLSTIDVYIHNVAKSVKKAGTGFWNIGKVDRTYWVEYSYRISLGINISDIQFEMTGDKIKITIPPAQVLSHGLDEKGIQEDKIVYSNDSFWNSNRITPEEQTKAVSLSMEESLLNFQYDKTQFDAAQLRAKDLIESYIDSVAKTADTEFDTEWELLPYTVPEDLEDLLKDIEDQREEMEQG